MSLNSSTSSSDASARLRRRSRLLPFVYFATCAALTATAFVNYKVRGLARHPEDIKLFELEHSRGSFRRLILSDSVTENATAGVVIDDADLPLMTHGWMRLAGQYFLMRRALVKNTLKAVDLFMVPDMLLADVDNEAQGRIRHTYTDTLFTRSEEIADLRRSGDREAGTRLVFFELLYKALQPAPRELPVRTTTQRASSRPVETAAVSEESRQRLEGRARALSAFAITPQNQFFLKHFAETCAERRIRCRFIIEPMPASLPRMNTSLLLDLASGVEIVDVNDFAVFPDFAFRDGLHLRSPDWTSYYRTILSDQGLMSFGSFVTKAAPWNGEKISFGTGPNDERLIRVAGFHMPEPWGCWIDGTLAEVFVNIGDGVARSRRLTMAITTLVKKGPQRVAVAINGEERCSETFLESGGTSVTCDLPDGMRGPTQIEISTSYASSPKDWGADDSRSLGVGLRSMSIQ